MAPPSVASDMDRGRQVGKYKILTRLSVGGMAELFLAYTAGPGGFKKFVALKQILPDIKADESFVKMFLDEARITAAFNHANIGQVFDLGEEQEELYLAMEFIAGQNLEQVIKRAAKREIELPIGFSARVVRDTCLGLHYAHHFVEPSGQPAPVVHRDISPKNVMVTYSGDVKVIDFGIAKARGRLGRTQVGVVKGTSGYMSPEQVRNEQLDGRSDLFCTATMLYELLTASRLFAVQGEVQMMLKIAEEEIPPPHTVNPAIPEALSLAVARGLEKKREERFSSGKEFARAIEQSAPELFDEDQVAAVMTQLFDDKIATTRALLELAKSEDTRAMTRAVEELKKEVEEPVKPARKPRAKATPGPRPGLTTPAQRAPSRGNLKPARKDTPTEAPAAKRPRAARATDEHDASDLDSTIPPRRAADPQKYQATRVFEEKAHARAERAEEDLERDRVTPPKGTPKAAEVGTHNLQALRAKARGGGEEETTAQKKKSGGGVGGFILFVLFLGTLGGGGWALWAGPLKDSGTGKMVHEWVAKQTTEQPVVDPNATQKIDVAPTDPALVPAWKREADEKAAAEKAERDRQAAIEAQQNDPEVKKNLEELDSQLKKLAEQEEELRQLKIAAAQGTATGATNSKKIDELEKRNKDLEKKIDEINKRLGPSGKRAPHKPAGEGGNVQVVKDDKSAQKAAVGYLTLYTVNPAQAAVFLGDQALGSTPLLKIPVEAGVHLLRVVDDESKNRKLSIKIEAGKTEEMKGVDVGSLPLAK